MKRHYGKGERLPSLQEVNPKEDKHVSDRHIINMLPHTWS
jgi:hypothetical protein